MRRMHFAAFLTLLIDRDRRPRNGTPQRPRSRKKGERTNSVLGLVLRIAACICRAARATTTLRTSGSAKSYSM